MIGRPDSTEAASSYFTYINQVNGDDPIADLTRQLEEFRAFFETISEEKSRHRYAPDKWSIRQLLSHVNDTERAFAFRTLWFARGFEDPLPGFDQDVSAATAAADQFSWASHVEEFQHVRLATLALFRNMPAEAWKRSGIASDKPFTVRALAFIMPGHTAHHVRILKERYF